jgi:hypothetical protein
MPDIMPGRLIDFLNQLCIGSLPDDGALRGKLMHSWFKKSINLPGMMSGMDDLLYYLIRNPK